MCCTSTINKLIFVVQKCFSIPSECPRCKRRNARFNKSSSQALDDDNDVDDDEDDYDDDDS